MMTGQGNSLRLTEVGLDSIEEFLRREWKPVNERMFGRYDAAMWDTQRRALAAYQNEELVGAVLFKIGSGLGKVTQIITSEAHRRQGIGRALMMRVEDICRQEGCHKVSLKTYWNSEAQRFYQKQGYVVEGILRRDLHGVDMCQMCKFL
jgi:ribosomal protein S18 acetylase RimI-like enzyme